MPNSADIWALSAATLLLAAGAGCGQPVEQSDDSSERSDNIAGKGDYFGQDDRQNPTDVNERLTSWARSTALIADQEDLTTDDDGNRRLSTTPYKEERNLCEDVRFAEEPSAGSCSAFLVDEQTVVTAGHCVDWGFSCDSARFVFDYGIYEEGDDPAAVDDEDVYQCEEVVAENYERGGALDAPDYAVVKLDEPVTDRDPLEVREEGRVGVGQHLVLIGYPDGIPVKVDKRGVVFHTGEKRFVATNDSFSGHSGGLVMNLSTGKVEAVHVASGGTRFERDEENGCSRPKRCQQAQIDGECQGSIGVYASVWRQHVLEGGGDAGPGDGGNGDVGVGDATDDTTDDTDVDAGFDATPDSVGRNDASTATDVHDVSDGAGFDVDGG